eukprot:scaffold127845_cov84-Attheya_sp.AAC.4
MARVTWQDAPSRCCQLHIWDTNCNTEAYTRRLTIALPKYMLLRTRFHVTHQGKEGNHNLPFFATPWQK